MGLKDEMKLLIPIILIVVSFGLIQENLKNVFPVVDGSLGLILGVLGLVAGIYFGFVRKIVG